MRSLEELYLRENESMKVIPRYIAKKRRLRILDVGENDIEKPQVEVTDGKMDVEETASKVTLERVEMSVASFPGQLKVFPHVDESQLACWGLGRGIKATEPKRLMQVVARPVPVDETNGDATITLPYVEETRVGTEYFEVTFKVSVEDGIDKESECVIVGALFESGEL